MKATKPTKKIKTIVLSTEWSNAYVMYFKK